MSVFSQRPEIASGNLENAPFIPDTTHRFHQIFFPALQLSSTLLTALGSKHRTGSSEVNKYCSHELFKQSQLILCIFSTLSTNTQQVIHFLLSHSDTISAILRNRNLSPVPAHLEEIALLTAVISRAAGWNSINDESPAAVEVRGQLSRLEQVTLNLLPVYILGTSLIRSHCFDLFQSFTRELLFCYD